MSNMQGSRWFIVYKCFKGINKSVKLVEISNIASPIGLGSAKLVVKSPAEKCEQKNKELTALAAGKLLFQLLTRLNS